jgi:aldehyde:ferredoxin oxidoreductase
MLPGYAGKIGWVDLTQETIRVDDLEESVARKYLGGKGLGAYFLYSHIKPNIDAYDPDNMLIFITGPLTGTTFPAVARSAVVTKSPMTGTFMDSFSGAYFGPHMKYAGYDALIIIGKAKRPSYLLVENGKVSVKSADPLWGLSTLETETHLKEEFVDQKPSVAAIGPAGENRVRFASIISEKRAYGRGGAGAVMGSKNLKAVVLIGKQKLKIANEDTFKEINNRCRANIKKHPMVGKEGIFPKIGTMMTVALTQATGTLPTRNWQENTFDHAAQIDGHAFEKYIVRPRACFACPIGCSRDSKVKQKGAEIITEGPEYETMYAFGPHCEIKDPAVIIAADKLCDDYGMDTISCGSVIGFAMECFDKGLINKNDTGGIDLSFGNGDAAIAVIHLMVKKEGIGKLLSEGVKSASMKIPGSAEMAIHVKGLEPPGYDPRGMKGQALTYAVADRGACHMRSNTIRTELLGLPEPVDRFGYEGKAQMVKELQISYATFDCLVACAFGGFAITPDDYAEAVSALTGWSFSVDELRRIAERAWNLTRLFNVREGFTKKDDALPQRLYSISSTRGPSKGEIVEQAAFDKMLSEYYQIVGWDENGIPTETKLKELGLER